MLETKVKCTDTVNPKQLKCYKERVILTSGYSRLLLAKQKRYRQGVRAFMSANVAAHLVAHHS